MATPATPDTDALKPYRPMRFPTIGKEDSVKRYVQKELQNISQSIALIVQVLEAHEARLAALGG